MESFQQNEIEDFSPQIQTASYQTGKTSPVLLKTEINLKCSENDISDSNRSDGIKQTFHYINPVTHDFYSHTDVILDLSPGSPENFDLPSAQLVSEKHSQFINTESSVQTSAFSEKPTFSVLPLEYY